MTFEEQLALFIALLEKGHKLWPKLELMAIVNRYCDTYNALAEEPESIDEIIAHEEQ